jgi:EmrB/QacA subfamily drug resistance transporter
MPALLLLCTAQFMLILDVTVVNVALPSIQEDVGVATSDLPWVVAAYTVAFGGLLLLGGRAADRLGRRRMFLTGLGVFTAASLASALATSPEMLIAARALQGVGAAILSPAALSLITAVFPAGAGRHRALAAWAAVAAAGGAVGVLVGGVLTEAFGWEAIFLINVPVGIAVGLAAVRVLPAVPAASEGRIDVAGGLLAPASLVPLIYGLLDADSAGWGSAQTLILFALAAAGIVAFILTEARVRVPLVPLSVFRRRPTVVALVLLVVGMGAVFSGFYFCSLYLQQVLGHSALRTGLEFLPVALAIVAAAHAGGRLVARIGAKVIIASGLALGAGGSLLLSGMAAGGTYVGDVLPGFLVLGVGGGLAASGVMITAMSGAGHEDAGLISGLTTTAHELGIALVLSVLSTIAASQIGGAALESAATADPESLTAGFADAFRVAAAIALAGAVLAVMALKRDDVAPGTTPAFAH